MLSQPPGCPSASGPIFAAFAAHAASSTSVRNTGLGPRVRQRCPASGRTTLPYFVGPEDTTNTDAPTASRKARREDVRLRGARPREPARRARLRSTSVRRLQSNSVMVAPQATGVRPLRHHPSGGPGWCRGRGARPGCSRSDSNRSGAARRDRDGGDSGSDGDGGERGDDGAEVGHHPIDRPPRQVVVGAALIDQREVDSPHSAAATYVNRSLTGP